MALDRLPEKEKASIILHYFEEVYASAEFGVRKPSSRFFEAAIADIQARHPEIKKQEMLFLELLKAHLEPHNEVRRIFHKQGFHAL